MTSHKINFNKIVIKPHVHKNSNVYKKDVGVNIKKKLQFDASKVIWNGTPFISVDTKNVINTETMKHFNFNQIMYADNKEVFYVAEKCISKTITECIKLRCKYQNAVIIAGYIIPTSDLLRKIDGIVDIIHIGVPREMKELGIDYPIASLLLESIYVMNKNRSNISVACSDIHMTPDISKALACGVDFVIIDDIIRGCSETNGNYKWINQKLYKCCDNHVSVCKSSVSIELNKICSQLCNTIYYMNGTDLGVFDSSEFVLID